MGNTSPFPIMPSFRLIVIAAVAVCWRTGHVEADAHCSLPVQGKNMYVRCSVGGQAIPCAGTMRPHTSIQFQCADFYMLEDPAVATVECLQNGNWSQQPPKCVPECGKTSSAVALIVHGTAVPAGFFPWQVALYHKNSESWDFQCGGSLISERMVLTAAHCAWQVPAEQIRIALGKQYREYNMTGDGAQVIQVRQVEMLDSYQDVNGNYNGDVALLILEKPAQFNQKVSPVCIDWNLQYIDQMLVEGNTGVALGWGLTENDTFSTELRALRLPVMSDEKCIIQQQRDFKKYITYTSFCAGYTNGTGVCNGDSGGGLSFLDPKSDTWYLQGLVSVSPRRRGTPFCDPTFYTVFTKVPMFTKWINQVQVKVKELEAKENLVPGAVQSNSEKILASFKKQK